MELEALIGQAIVKRRKELGLSQEVLSKKSGIDRRYLSDIEHGTRSVSITVLKNLAKELDWTMTELMAASEPTGRFIENKPQAVYEKFAVKLGKTITRIRQEEMLSEELFSRLIGLSAKDTSDIEAGEIQVPLDTLEKIAIALRKTTSELLLEAEKSE